MTEDDWDFFNRSVGKLEKEVITLKKENAQLKTEYEKECHRADELEDSYWKSEKENQKLKKQLTIAIEALKCYGQENWTYADEYNYIPWNEYTGGWCHAEKALEQIKELKQDE